MSCEDFGDHLTAFSLGELGPAEAERAREHLTRCSRCASLVLRDRQLVSVLRASALPAPSEVHRAVRSSLDSVRRRRARRLLVRVATLAAALAVAVTVAVVSFSPERPAGPTTPLAAAWSAFGAERLPLDQPPDDRAIHTLIGSGSAAPDLAGLGLKVASVGSLRLAGQPAVGAEYRGPSGERLAFFRWRGQLPQAAGDYPEGAPPKLQTSSWGPTQSAWWEHDGLVYCLVGTLDEPAFDAVVTRVQQTI